MRVLITGATGFIGSRLALSCLDNGDAVRVLTEVNNSSEEMNRNLLEQAGAELILGSVTDTNSVARAVDGVELVYHLAAAQHEANVPDRHFWEVNARGTEKLLEASVSTGVKRFVHGSTIGVYGSAVEGELDETSPAKPDNIYGVTKYEGEKLALSLSGKLSVVVVRISETYGPGDRRLLKLFKAIDRGVFFMIGSGLNKHQLIFVDDLVQGLLLAAETPGAIGKTFVLAGPDVLTTRDMVTSIAAALGRSGPRLRLPLWPFSIAALVLEKTLRPIGVQPPLHPRRLDFFRKRVLFSGKRAAQVLNFVPRVDFKEGVAVTADWYRAQGLL
jgi:nucleoside-diphosphate-sugar epimerase